MKSIFDEEEEILYRPTYVPIIRRGEKRVVASYRSPPPRQFTRADIRKRPTSEIMWGRRTTVPMTKRDIRRTKLRAQRSVMY